MGEIDKIKEYIKPVITELDLKLYDVEWITENKNRFLRISISQHNNMIDLETCTLASEKMSEILDQLPELDFAYLLEVCSPGAERQLRDLEDIKAAINEHVYVKLKEPSSGIHEVTGDLSEANDDQIIISYKDKTRTKTLSIQIANISYIRLAIKF